MQIIPIRASRPALAPVPRILPDDMDDLLDRRRDAIRAAVRCNNADRAAMQLRFWERLTAIVDRSDKQ